MKALLDLDIQVYEAGMDINCKQFQPKTKEQWLNSKLAYQRLIAELERIVALGPETCPFAKKLGVVS